MSLAWRLTLSEVAYPTAPRPYGPVRARMGHGCHVPSSKGTKLHFKSPTAERSHFLCVEVGGNRTQAARPGGAGYACLSQLD